MDTNAQKPSLFDGLKTEYRQTVADLRQLAKTRWKLAQLEVKAAKASVQRYGISLAAAGVVALTSLPILVIAAVDSMGNAYGMPRWFWLAVTGGVMLLGAGAFVWFAKRKFQREFVGLEETLEEFREDVVWLKEWLGETKVD